MFQQQICKYGASAGEVMASPSPRAAVCHAGDRLEVTCTTNASILVWNVHFIGSNEHMQEIITSTIQVQVIERINSSVFIYSRISELQALPLTSELLIISVSSSLNGSNITCMELDNSASTMATTLYIIGDDGG